MPARVSAGTGPRTVPAARMSVQLNGRADTPLGSLAVIHHLHRGAAQTASRHDPAASFRPDVAEPARSGARRDPAASPCEGRRAIALREPLAGRYRPASTELAAHRRSAVVLPY